MEGYCEDCGGVMAWERGRWRRHSKRFHEEVRQARLAVIRRQLQREMHWRALRTEAALTRDVLIRWVSGVYWYRGHRVESWSRVPGDVWDAMDHDRLMRDLRTGVNQQFRGKYGAEINQATWRHRVYDDRDQWTALLLERAAGNNRSALERLADR